MIFVTLLFMLTILIIDILLSAGFLTILYLIASVATVTWWGVIIGAILLVILELSILGAYLNMEGDK